MKNILIPYDFSAVGERLLNMAMDLAKPMGAKVWVVHVAAPDPDFVGFKVGPQYVRDHRADILRQEHQDLQDIAKRLNDQGTETEALLVQGPTVDTLLEVAGRVHADLILVGSHGRSALFRAFVGSVSEQLLKDSKVPVMVVPSPR